MIDTSQPAAVKVAVADSYRTIFPGGDVGYVDRVFGWALDCFQGRYSDYLPIDARYHDLEHTLQGTMCMSRLLEGRHRRGAEPVMTERMHQLGIAAILLHDTGYLKHRFDDAGTGAKYTATHVNRSMDFARTLLLQKGFTAVECQSVRNMIRCTGLNVNLSAIEFQSDLERLMGHALGTADLLGQMAAPDYPEKLSVLFAEFEESSRFSGQPGMFKSVDDLIVKTPGFWEKYVLPKANNDFGGLYHFLEDETGRNAYLESIERNIGRIMQLKAA